MQSPVDAEQLGRCDNLLSSTQPGFSQGLQAEPNQAWTHSHLRTWPQSQCGGISPLHQPGTHSRPPPDVAIMYEPPLEVLINTAHISRLWFSVKTRPIPHRPKPYYITLMPQNLSPVPTPMIHRASHRQVHIDPGSLRSQGVHWVNFTIVYATLSLSFPWWI